MNSSKNDIYDDLIKNPKLANQYFTYLVNKYAPDRTDLLERLSQDNEIALNYVKYYLAEIECANNWKTNYSQDDLKIVGNLGSFL